MGYLYLTVPASGTVMCLFALEHFVDVLRGRSLPSQGAHDPAAAPHVSSDGFTDKRPINGCRGHGGQLCGDAAA